MSNSVKNGNIVLKQTKQFNPSHNSYYISDYKMRKHILLHNLRSQKILDMPGYLVPHVSSL